METIPRITEMVTNPLGAYLKGIRISIFSNMVTVGTTRLAMVDKIFDEGGIIVGIVMGFGYNEEALET